MTSDLDSTPRGPTDRRSVAHSLTPLLFLAACTGGDMAGGASGDAPGESMTASDYEATVDIEQRLSQYATVRLTSDLATGLSETDRQVVRLLIEAALPMEEAFWRQAYGDRNALRSEVADPDTWRFVEINKGPWDRLAGDEPFLAGVGPKPAGANFYPADMTDEEFDAALEGNPALDDLYTLVRRDAEGELTAIPYHEAFTAEHEAAAAKLREAAGVTADPELALYLELRADALLTDDYRASDMAWLDMKSNAIDIVIGPIETYEDQRYGYKAAHEAFVLVKDLEWSARLSRFAALLPDLQRGLPVEERFKSETPGTDSDLNAYDVVFVAGDADAGSKTIAINLPNDEQVQLEKGTRRLQLKNAMRAKFDRILVPVADVLIDEDQRDHITFDAFFANTMFHEVAHGLGVKNVVDGDVTVREALREHASAMEEGKADILGLYMITELLESGEITDGSLEDYYTTFLASIFRSVRFGASSAHGRANMVRFNYFQEQGAFTRDETTGTYRVDMEGMRRAMTGLGRAILTLQGEGDYEGAGVLLEERGRVPDGLQNDLDRLAELGIPVDIVYEQGVDVLFPGGAP